MRPAQRMMIKTRVNENWKPGAKSSSVSQARMANAAAARLLQEMARRSKSEAVRSSAAMIVARTLLVRRPVMSV